MRKIISAILLVFLLTSVTAGHTSEPIRPIAANLWKPVEIPQTPKPTASSTPTPTPKPTEKPKPKSRQVDKTYAIITGIASTYGAGYAGYLALPEGPGIKVRVCGPAACIERVSNDAGPDKAMQRKGRVIDLNSRDFNIVCGCDWSIKGLVAVRVEYLR